MGRSHIARPEAETAKFPIQQLLILSLCRLCEPIAFMSIFPYIYYMVEGFNITSDKTQISMYAGLVTSAFTIAEFSSGIVWGKLSDRIGRKPVLIAGLAGTGLSMLVFGFAPSFPVALLARALGGLLNGNIGVLQTTVAELVTVKEHQPRAYTFMPTVWCIGSILGPMLGGALARPHISYPTLFPSGSIFEKFPYLLPNLVCTSVVVIGVVVGILFLEETSIDKKDQRDRGLEMGQWLVSTIKGRISNTLVTEKRSEILLPLVDEAAPPRYSTTEFARDTTSEVTAERHAVAEKHEKTDMVEKTSLAMPKVFTAQVILNIVCYGLLAYHTITFDSLLPIFLSTPDTSTTLSNSLKFVGGFGFSTKQIGWVMSMQGGYSMFATVVLFPKATRMLGTLRLLQLLAMLYPLLYISTPFVVTISDPLLRTIALAIIIVWKCTFANFAYPSMAMLLANLVPSTRVLGTVNGVSSSTASLARAIGPTVSGLVFTTGFRIGYSVLVWWITAAVTVLAAILSLYMVVESEHRVDEKTELYQDIESHPSNTSDHDHRIEQTASTPEELCTTYDSTSTPLLFHESSLTTYDDFPLCHNGHSKHLNEHIQL